jgi:isopentenyldiphosphate isomerase
VAQSENDGRWTARIENTSYAAVQPVDVWEFEIDEVKALLADKLPTPQAREGSAATWIKHVCPNDEWGLMSAKDVHRKVVLKAEELEVKPPSYSAVAAALRKLKRQT